MTKEVELLVSNELPNKFAVIMDGWTDTGTSTHYLSVRACNEDPQSTNEVKFVLLAFTPLLDESDFSAQNQTYFSRFCLSVYNEDVSNAILIIVYNVNTNIQVCDHWVFV